MTSKVRQGVPAHWMATLAVTLLIIACNGLGGVAKPQVTVKIGGAPVPTAMGSYCWSSGGQSECADMASIDAVIQAGGLSPIRVLANNPGAISFDSLRSRWTSSLDPMKHIFRRYRLRACLFGHHQCWVDGSTCCRGNGTKATSAGCFWSRSEVASPSGGSSN